MIKNLHGTIDLPLHLRGDGTGKIKWWVNASYAVHPDMKGHTGAMLSLGSGSIYSMSSKQSPTKLNQKWVMGVHDVLPQAICTDHFLKGQSIAVNEIVMYQDNMSSMLLEKNGRSSSSKCTWHMNIWFFH